MEKNLQILDTTNYHRVKIGNSALFSKMLLDLESSADSRVKNKKCQLTTPFY